MKVVLVLVVLALVTVVTGSLVLAVATLEVGCILRVDHIVDVIVVVVLEVSRVDDDVSTEC